MKQILGLFGLLIGMMLVVAWLSKPGSLSNLIPQNTFQIAQNTQSPSTPQPSPKPVVKIGNNEFKTTIAKTSQERQTGLSKHTSLGENEGMLFSFGKENVRTSMWMKGMAFPIDIIWINDGKISQISQDVPTVPATTPDNKIPLYVPHQPIDYILEVPAGTTKQKGIKTGDTVEIPEI